jgi:hypothetical protein
MSLAMWIICQKLHCPAHGGTCCIVAPDYEAEYLKQNVSKNAMDADY